MSTQPARASAVRAAYGDAFDAHSAYQKPLSVVGVWLARSRQRKALQELAQDARLLDDIGLNRQEALDEAAKPFRRA